MTRTSALAEFLYASVCLCVRVSVRHHFFVTYRLGNGKSQNSNFLYDYWVGPRGGLGQVTWSGSLPVSTGSKVTILNNGLFGFFFSPIDRARRDEYLLYKFGCHYFFYF